MRRETNHYQYQYQLTAQTSDDGWWRWFLFNKVLTTMSPIPFPSPFANVIISNLLFKLTSTPLFSHSSHKWDSPSPTLEGVSFLLQNVHFNLASQISLSFVTGSVESLLLPTFKRGVLPVAKCSFRKSSMSSSSMICSYYILYHSHYISIFP